MTHNAISRTESLILARTNRPTGQNYDAISDRTFGLFLGTIAGGVSLWPILSSQPLRTGWMVVSSVLLLAGILAPAFLHWPKVAWMTVTHKIAGVVSYLLLAILFFLVFTPVAIFFRLIGRDALKLSVKEGASSYWTARSDAMVVSDLRHPY